MYFFCNYVSIFVSVRVFSKYRVYWILYVVFFVYVRVVLGIPVVGV